MLACCLLSLVLSVPVCLTPGGWVIVFHADWPRCPQKSSSGPSRDLSERQNAETSCRPPQSAPAFKQAPRWFLHAKDWQVEVYPKRAWLPICHGQLDLQLPTGRYSSHEPGWSRKDGSKCQLCDPNACWAQGENQSLKTGGSDNFPKDCSSELKVSALNSASSHLTRKSLQVLWNTHTLMHATRICYDEAWKWGFFGANLLTPFPKRRPWSQYWAHQTHT